MVRRVQGIAEVTVVGAPADLAAAGEVKPFLRVRFENGVIVEMSTNLAEMIGGAAAGVRKRQEDLAAARPAGSS